MHQILCGIRKDTSHLLQWNINFWPSSEEVIGNGDLVALEHELIDEVRSNESAATGDQDPLSVLVIEKFYLGVIGSRVAFGNWNKKPNLYQFINSIRLLHLFQVAESSNSSPCQALSVADRPSFPASAWLAPSRGPSRHCRPRRGRRGPRPRRAKPANAQRRRPLRTRTKMSLVR